MEDSQWTIEKYKSVKLEEHCPPSRSSLWLCIPPSARSPARIHFKCRLVEISVPTAMGTNTALWASPTWSSGTCRRCIPPSSKSSNRREEGEERSAGRGQRRSLARRLPRTSHRRTTDTSSRSCRPRWTGRRKPAPSSHSSTNATLRKGGRDVAKSGCLRFLCRGRLTTTFLNPHECKGERLY